MELMTYLATQETNTVFTSSGEGGIYSYHAATVRKHVGTRTL